MDGQSQGGKAVAGARRPRLAAVEAGAVETEMHDDSGAPSVPPADLVMQAVTEDGRGEDVTPPPQPTQADLTGPEMAEIRVRNEAVDTANKAAAKAQADAAQAARLAQYAQEALTQLITNLIGWKNLDQNFVYAVDLERGRIVNRGPSRGMRG